MLYYKGHKENGEGKAVNTSRRAFIGSAVAGLATGGRPLSEAEYATYSARVDALGFIRRNDAILLGV